MEATKSENDAGEETSNHEGSPESPSLPQEVFTEILLRSPARSVGRFRCVSKAFCSLLSHPKFAKSHLDLILRNDAVRSRNRRLILSLNNLFAVGFDSIGGGGEGTSDLTAVELDYPFKEDLDLLSETKRETVTFRLWGGTEMTTFDSDSDSPKRSWVDIVGSSNGLVCISSDEDIAFLFNPTTGESKRIPDLPESLSSKSVDEELVEIEILGFGFDALTDDYKVVKFVASNDGDLNAYLYSLRGDSWRRISDLRYRHVHPRSGVHLNGAVHWIVKLEQGQNERVIAAFDLETDKFREVSLPGEAEDCDHMFMKLEVGILKGCLCVVYSCYEMHDVMWVMNEYGLVSSWSKIRISISYISMKPLCSTENDHEEVLLVLDRNLVLYNFKWNTLRNLEIGGVDLGVEFEASTYVESIISPNSYGTES